MPAKEDHFHTFIEPIDSYTLPERFTFPFYYQPHPLCLLAAKELQDYLTTQVEWQHDFGISGDNESASGKMFGVLLVQNKDKEIGYLAAFSGKLTGESHLSKFVPPVFDHLADNSFYHSSSSTINSINRQITELESEPEFLQLKSVLKTEKERAISQIQEHRALMIETRKNRKSRRTKAEIELSQDDYLHLNTQLSKESISDKNRLKTITADWDDRIQKIEEKLNRFTSRIAELKLQRKELSASLQQKIFSQYRFLNTKGRTKSLIDIFKETPQQTPPSAAGECAAPKLLQYAFANNLTPLAMAEFWWGASPKSEIRKHQNFYGACQGKCQPILGHMLEGLDVDENPLLINPGKNKNFEIVYEDEDILVINKPSELLSVPGKNIEDSVYHRIKQSHPDATGPLIVHRLDMATSGILLVALNKESHKNLQRQFTKRTVSKRYIALLDGLLDKNEGIIDLPLRVDLDDRPRQLVCYEHGKPARTQWKVIERKNNKTLVNFYPVTGRTHQLRVHSAHLNGLNTPIVGDDLYGTKSSRLHLHAEYIEFKHPVTGESLSFKIDAEF